LLTGSLLDVDPNRLAHLAAGVEMLHTATLIHDDLIDGSTLRRGMETLNMQWSPAATVLAGDFAFTRAAELVTAVDSIPVMRLFSKSMSVMVAGELLQLINKRGITSREEYFQWINAKTATLFELATGAAALLSQADANTISAARLFGHELGMAFQIMDDILDFTGDPSNLGKPVGSDLRQGVLTLPTIFYYETHSNDPDLQAIICGERLDEQGVEQLLIRIRRSKALAAATNVAQVYITEGLKALQSLPDVPQRKTLSEIAQTIITRNN